MAARSLSAAMSNTFSNCQGHKRLRSNAIETIPNSNHWKLSNITTPLGFPTFRTNTLHKLSRKLSPKLSRQPRQSPARRLSENFYATPNILAMRQIRHRDHAQTLKSTEPPTTAAAAKSHGHDRNARHQTRNTIPSPRHSRPKNPPHSHTPPNRLQHHQHRSETQRLRNAYQNTAHQTPILHPTG
ncbi:hypothetical protein M758_7G024600 [Ceratodon purpureus]|uniref:Uncharacterized protein n=1 Tax=Ceratodon purpureus TaxID=3225 RepID=A0A8T0HA09_CERPU|nr:hypothetical protein KC19_7G025500 [Ceratodon purpureus]KAG0609927.1 hypothetical protein M758_7G024600 [Ceratodon purpureus]